MINIHHQLRTNIWNFKHRERQRYTGLYQQSKEKNRREKDNLHEEDKEGSKMEIMVKESRQVNSECRSEH